MMNGYLFLSKTGGKIMELKNFQLLHDGNDMKFIKIVTDDELLGYVIRRAKEDKYYFDYNDLSKFIEYQSELLKERYGEEF